MPAITARTHIPVSPDKVVTALTTTAGHRAFWARDCELGRATGGEAVYRFDAIEVVFRIDRIDGRGLVMTCVRHKNCPEWLSTRVSMQALPDRAGTTVEFVHDGWREETKFFEMCRARWASYVESLRALFETGRGMPFAASGAG